MAKLNAIIPMSGSIDNVTLRKQKDGSVVASLKISKRRPTRTKGTMRAQLPMGNLNAMARELTDKESWENLMEGCETKRKARGRFIGLNMKRGMVYFTKEQQKNAFCILCSHQISHGSLRSIGQNFLSDNRMTTDIRLTKDIAPQLTQGDFSADLLACNPEFKDGDTLTLYTFQQIGDDEHGFHVHMDMYPICLNRLSDVPLSKLVNDGLLCRHEGFLTLAAPLSGTGACFVRRSRDGRGKKLVSSQILLCVNPLAEEFSTNEAFEAAVASRGGYTDVPRRFRGAESSETAAEAVQNQQAFYVTVFSNDLNAGHAATGRGTYKAGTPATLTAVPTEGHRFLRWTNQDGEVISTQPVCQVPIDGDAAFMAYFE